eukprot:TRINITY_DN32974_c0_g1_i1.p1 TRINITY_DN32974_c0_g1~~TRINITY_DN32974_c0_g1_i1.p1  ORF type:complete len:247 (+),score=12.93 TRINITY_DN32974_c0_g1_i1:69-809(+)
MSKKAAHMKYVLSRRSKFANPLNLFASSGPVKLTLQPFGRLGMNEYRLVAMRSDLDEPTGTPFEILGYFDPHARKDLYSPETPQAYDRMMFRKCLMDFDRVKWWISRGASMTAEVQTLLSMAGLTPPAWSQAGLGHLPRYDWGSKDDLYDYWLRTRPTPAEMAAEERYHYYDGVPGQKGYSGQRDAEREQVRMTILNKLDTKQGLAESLLGTKQQRELSRWRGPIGSLPRGRYMRVGPARFLGATS